MILEMKRKTYGILASIVAVLFAAVAMVGPAHALVPSAPGGEPEDGPTLGNIDFDAKGSITVHKLVRPDTELSAGDGTEQIIDGAQTLGGVKFKIEKIDLDLKTDEGWKKLRELQEKQQDDPQGYQSEISTLPKVKPAVSEEQTTKPNGEAIFNGLDLGVYLVTETEAGENNVAVKAAPFLVTIPLPNGPNWLYDVHVYPKNTLADVEKTVDDSGATKEGDTVTWHVYSVIPALESNQDLTSLIVKDSFDKRLTFSGADSVKVAVVDKTGSEPDAAVLELKQPEFEVTVGEVTGEGRTPVTVKIAEDGLKKLKDHQGKHVRVTFPTTVNSVDPNGVIPNQAEVFINDPGTENGIKTGTPETHWGRIQLTKVDSADETVVLQDAEFAIYASNEDAKAGKDAIMTMTTNEKGVALSGLLKTDKDDPVTYYVKETKAPTGYVLDETVRPVTVNPASTNGIQIMDNVKNVKSDVPELPLTGASGQLLMMIGGGAIILMAAGVAFVAYKRRNV